MTTTQTQSPIDDAKFFKDFIRLAVKAPIEYLETYIDPKLAAPTQKGSDTPISSSSIIVVKVQIVGQANRHASVRVNKTVTLDRFKAIALKELGYPNDPSLKASFVYKGVALTNDAKTVSASILDPTVPVHVTIKESPFSNGPNGPITLGQSFWNEFSALLSNHVQNTTAQTTLLEGFRSSYSGWLKNDK